MVKRLKDRNFPYSYKHINYEYASHLIIPIQTGMEKYFKIEKNYPAECEKSKQDSLKEVIQCLVEVW
ncbi:hypothetical protein [Candidatus Pseudoruminococcus sp.]|uniref:hypothetical protein n=1 Tax=Candidatus Pseudoruminococcus sp. TaxID=3101048 RepID=UPI00399B3672